MDKAKYQRELWAVGIRILFNLVALQMAMVIGCSSKPQIGEEQAIAVAKQEAFRRGWKKLEVGSARLDGGLWIVDLERLPKVYGGHATVEVSTNGNVIRYLPGL